MRHYRPALGNAVTHLAPSLPSARIETIIAAYKDSYYAQVGCRGQRRTALRGRTGGLGRAVRRRLRIGGCDRQGAPGLINLLEGHNLRDHFISFQSADDVPGKPHPAMLLQALDTVALAPEDAVMIGDTSFDMEMVRNVAVVAVAVTWGYHDRRRLAEHSPAATIDDV